jgi:hypothetical protein
MRAERVPFVRKSGTIRTSLVFEAGDPSEFRPPLSNSPKQDRWSNELRFPRTGKLLCAEEPSAIVPDVSQHLRMGWVSACFDYFLFCSSEQAKRAISKKGRSGNQFRSAPTVKTNIRRPRWANNLLHFQRLSARFQIGGFCSAVETAPPSLDLTGMKCEKDGEVKQDKLVADTENLRHRVATLEAVRARLTIAERAPLSRRQELQERLD